MINRKTILYLMFIIITIILMYNYAVNPLLMQYRNNMSMHMGMNRGFYNNYNNSFGVIYLLAVIFLILVIVLIVELILSKEKINRCSKCGYKIEEPRWRKCPICGNNLGEKRK